MAHPRRPSMPRRMPRLGSKGTSALEFALLAPVVLLLTLGTLDLGFIAMVDASLEMAVREASRYGIVSTDDEDETRDTKIRETVENWMSRWETDESVLDISSLTYTSFDNVGEPEPYSDANGNGTYDSGEDYTDVNGNGTWDDDMGTASFGGSEDIVLYEVDFTRKPLTGITSMIGLDSLHFSRRIIVQNE